MRIRFYLQINRVLKWKRKEQQTFIMKRVINVLLKYSWIIDLGDGNQEITYLEERDRRGSKQF